MGWEEQRPSNFDIFLCPLCVSPELVKKLPQDIAKFDPALKLSEVFFSQYFFKSWKIDINFARSLFLKVSHGLEFLICSSNFAAAASLARPCHVLDPLRTSHANHTAPCTAPNQMGCLRLQAVMLAIITTLVK